MSPEALIQEIAKLQDQLETLYGNLPALPKTERHRIAQDIKSGEGLTTVQEYCTYSRRCPATVYNHINKGILPQTVKVGGRVYFKNHELRAMEEAL
jgi:predicted DNA-binding transcriptional regulator AlpA